MVPVSPFLSAPPLLLLLLVVVPHLIISSSCSQNSLDTDKAALLAFKDNIVSDPTSTLANWNSSVHVCNFSGILCDRQLHSIRVVDLDLQDANLVGLLSPILSNLTGLITLNLVNNYLSGTIPPEFSSLRHLRHIRLDGNDLDGTIPASFSLLSNLTMVTIIGNNLSGTIPPSLFRNCTLLDNVDLSNNLLRGEIPQEIGNCLNLWNLNLYNNQLTGQIPVSLTNATSMYNIDVEYNHLSGQLPSEIVAKLPSLHYLHLSYNDIREDTLDTFFTALANCSGLEELELAGLGLGGRLPPDSIGRLGVNLTTLLLQENHIFGSIPSSITNLSSLTLLNLTSNLLTGWSINIGQLMPVLEQLFLSHNLFEGEIPEAIGQLRHIGLLDLSNNRFTGEIPTSLGNLVRAESIFLNNNLLSGKIPPSLLGQCSGLNKLDLSYNQLSGEIPQTILGVSEIRIFLNLSHNNLEGPLPMELSKLEKVQEMDLSFNNLNGTIFYQISNCIELSRLDLSNNSLKGSLPDSLGDLKNLGYLDVSRNKLSGLIPNNLAKVQTLTFLNLAYNNFKGEVPNGGIFSSTNITSFLHNKGHLCGDEVSGMTHCSSSSRSRRSSRKFLIIFAMAIFVSAFVTIICCAIGFRRVKIIISSRRRNKRSRKLQRSDPAGPMHNFPRISYRELEDTTGGFNEGNLIGSGSYGRVFRGALSDGTAVAVKVLLHDLHYTNKSFERECQVLKRIRHRNLMRIITACSLPDFKALVLPFMANGSLDRHLYPPSRASSEQLSLIQRISICSDIAEGMAYLHHHSPVKVIHCDLKPSNVLLNDDMTALVSDFGISRLVMPTTVVEEGVANYDAAADENMGNSTADRLCGSIGYIAPEYGFGSNTSTKGDVYSFGVIVLEMVTRKRPTDDMFGEGLSLQKWIKRQLYQKGMMRTRMERVIDSSLLRASSGVVTTPEVRKMWQVAIFELIELGILCTQDLPSSRPTMLDVADDLDRLQRYLTGDSSATFASSLGISSSAIGDEL